MNDIKDIKKGDIIYMGHDDFDGKGINECIVREVHDDHILCFDTSDKNIKYWLDEDTKDLFYKDRAVAAKAVGLPTKEEYALYFKLSNGDIGYLSWSGNETVDENAIGCVGLYCYNSMGVQYTGCELDVFEEKPLAAYLDEALELADYDKSVEWQKIDEDRFESMLEECESRQQEEEFGKNCDSLRDRGDYEDREYVRNSTAGDYSPSNPWDAPGMSIRDFI